MDVMMNDLSQPNSNLVSVPRWTRRGGDCAVHMLRMKSK
jgi:hypothetical protein